MKNGMGGTCRTYWGEEGAYRILLGEPEGKKPLEGLGLDGRIILNRSSKNKMEMHGLD